MSRKTISAAVGAYLADHHGPGIVFAVYVNNEPTLFVDNDEAHAFADEHDADVLDYANGCTA